MESMYKFQNKRPGVRNRQERISPAFVVQDFVIHKVKIVSVFAVVPEPEIDGAYFCQRIDLNKGIHAQFDI